MSEAVSLPAESAPSAETQPEPEVVWGGEAIGKIVKLPKAQVFYYLSQGVIPGKKVGRKWRSERGALLRWARNVGEGK
jgi:hypothetical protein